MKPLSGLTAAFTCFVLLVAMFAFAWYVPPGLNWILVLLCFVVFVIVLGLHIVARPAGILVNERNLMSLSRLQMVLWTVVVLSAYFTMAIIRIKAEVEDPLAIEIDWHLWALLGISTTSLVGTPLILATKKTKEPDPNEVEKTAKVLKEPEGEVNSNRQGILYGNTKASDAQFADMFQGDELKNTDHIDVAKVQMFFFTVIAVFAYCVMLFHAFKVAELDLGLIEAFPKLPDGLVAILGISHAGYLTSKSVDRTKTV